MSRSGAGENGALSATREAIGAARRTVVKVGSSSLTNGVRGLDPDRLDALVDGLAKRRLDGRQVVLVSSGAIASGLAPLGFARRPRDLATQQAAASVGQMLLVERYARSFARHGLTVGQVLLTADDLHRRAHYRNAHRTLERLLHLGVVPIINENDTVATDEIRFGDNDRLAALVSHLVSADALILLSDVDGLYDGNPRRGGATRLTEVGVETDLAGVRTGGAGSGIGLGGMATKIEAARIATGAGVPVLIAAAADAEAALSAGSVGTSFEASGRRPGQRMFWLRWATTPRGRLVLDAGAVRAVAGRRMSLLPAGVLAVEGDFDADDPVELVDESRTPIARGLVAYDSTELPALLGRRTRELGPEHQREVVHRDDIVLL